MKSKLSSLLPILECAKKIGDAVLNREYDNHTIRSLLSQQVSAYSKAKTVKADDLVGLLDDSSDGLNEIQQTVESLTNYSHVDTSMFEKVAIDSAVKRALKMCKSRFGDRRISCELGKKHLYVNGVSNQLTQVFTNLLNNALDATDEEKGVVSINAAANDDGFVELKISDNGHGIDEDILDKVMDPFFTTKDVGEGTGLGLSVSHQIISAHEGEINIESEPNSLTTFVIKLPLLVRDPQEQKMMPEKTFEGDTFAPA